MQTYGIAHITTLSGRNRSDEPTLSLLPLTFVQVAVKASRSFDEEPISSHRKVSLKVRRELEIWKRLNHPNVLPFLGIATGFGPSIALVSEWMPNGTLHEFLHENNAMMTTEIRLQLVRVPKPITLAVR